MNTPERHSFQGGSDGHHDPVPQFRLPVPEAFLSGARVQTAPPPVPRCGVLQPLRGAGEGRRSSSGPFPQEGASSQRNHALHVKELWTHNLHCFEFVELTLFYYCTLNVVQIILIHTKTIPFECRKSPLLDFYFPAMMPFKSPSNKLFFH